MKGVLPGVLHGVPTQLSRKTDSHVEASEIIKDFHKSQRYHQNYCMELLTPGKGEHSCIFNDI